MDTRALTLLSDSDLLSSIPAIVRREREATAEMLAHLAEIDRRKLYVGESCSSLHAFCIERLGYSENGALKRVRAARVAARFPQVLDELRNGTLHLTALFLLAPHLSNENAEALLAECRGKTRKEIEHVLARWFPRPDVAAGIEPAFEQQELGVQPSAGGAATARLPVPGHAASNPSGRLEPLPASRYLVQFTASAELRNKLEQALDLLSHVFPIVTWPGWSSARSTCCSPPN